MVKQKKDNILNHINLKNPYHIWGFILVIIGVTLGGGLGGLIGGMSGFSIIQLELNSTKKSSHLKKIGIYSLITIGAFFAYLVLASILLTILPQNA